MHSSEDTMQIAETIDGQRVLRFLSGHQLAPTPQNYTLAYIALTEPHSLIGRAVNAFVRDDLRIWQRDADKIFAMQEDEAQEAEKSAEHLALQRQALKLSEMTASAAQVTETFVRDLDYEAQALCQTRAPTIEIVNRMIGQSRQAEANFKAASAEIETLRLELSAARNDAERDSLTGLGNRRAAERVLRQLGEERQPRTIAFIDIDNFKTINDRYGHEVGDRVLKLVASSLLASCGPHFVGRWGGEEFLVVMPGTPCPDGVELVDKARADLAGRYFRLRETDEPLGQITFSAGLALADGGPESNEAAIRDADANMYRAKETGRNRVLG